MTLEELDAVPRNKWRLRLVPAKDKSQTWRINLGDSEAQARFWFNNFVKNIFNYGPPSRYEMYALFKPGVQIHAAGWMIEYNEHEFNEWEEFSL